MLISDLNTLKQLKFSTAAVMAKLVAIFRHYSWFHVHTALSIDEKNGQL